jgi:hypothetical protein
MNRNHKHIQNPDHIFVIGNGFDLNLGLKTSYSDFAENSDFVKYEAIPNTLIAHLKTVYGEKKWIDIENELKKFEKDNTDFRDEYNLLCNMILNYMLFAGSAEINTKSHAYNALRDACNSNFLIIDFNYTKSVNKILEKLAIYDSGQRHISIHGSVDRGEIIFGIEDSYDVNEENMFLQKSYSKIYGGYNIYELLQKADIVSFFGHSLGETDHSYFRSYFRQITQNQLNKNIFIYHYGDKGHDQIQVQLSKLTSSERGAFRDRNHVTYIDTSLPVENKWY